MLSTYIIIIVLASLSGLTTLIGALLAVGCRRSHKLIALGIGFSAGIMIFISVFELIPESLTLMSIKGTGLAVLSGILLVYFLNLIIPHQHLTKERGNINGYLTKTAYLIAFGLILHDFPEGFAMANSYIASPQLGVLLAVAIALHNIPEEFAMAVPIVAIRNWRFLIKAAIISGLAEPAGAIIGILAVHIYPSLLAWFLSLAAGAMIFISIHELMPMARKYRHFLLFLSGIMLSGLVYWCLQLFLPE